MLSNRQDARLPGLLSRSPRDLAAVALIFALLGVAGTWPLAANLAGNSVAGPANNDVFLNQYLVFWGAHALLTAPTSLYHPNMFHPARYTFAYADMLLSSSVLLAPVIVWSENPTLTYNLLLLTSIVIGGVGMYVLGRLMVPWRWAALGGAVVFVFNPLHFSRYQQPQLFTDHWLPWLLWALLLWLETCGMRPRDARRDGSAGAPRGSLRWAGLAAVLFCLHALTGSHNAIFGTLLAAAVLLFHAVRTVQYGGLAGLVTRRFIQGAAVGSVICLAVLGSAFYPYVAVGDLLLDQRITSGRGEAAVLDDGAARLQELLLGSSRFHAWLDRTAGWPTAIVPSDRNPRGELFPGVVVLALAGAGALMGAARAATRSRIAAVLDVVALAGAAFAAGALSASLPSLHWLGVSLALGHMRWVLAATAVAVVARLALSPGEPHVLVRAGRCARDAWERDPDRFLWTLLAVVCLLLALGPATWLYGLVQAIPGARLIRVPRRFLMPGALAMSLLAARGLWVLAQRRGPRAAPALAVILALFLAESWYAPLPTAPAPYPREPVHEWLAEQPGDFAILEVPISTGPTAATRQMIGSVYHWKKLLVGYSGSVPAGYLDWMERLEQRFPDPDALADLYARDVRFVLVLESRAPASLKARIESADRLRLVRQFDGLRVFELLAAED